MSQEIRILIADDHRIFRQGVASVLSLETDLTVIAEAANGREAVEAFSLHEPHVTLMDLQMPVMNGIEAVAAIRKEFPAARIILLTTYDTDGDIRYGLNAGASGYLLKDASPDELIESIRAVHQGRKRLSPEIGAKLAAQFDAPVLSERELDVLKLITAGNSNREIGEKLFISEATVKFHVSHVLGKLGVADRTQAVIYALKHGLTKIE